MADLSQSDQDLLHRMLGLPELIALVAAMKSRTLSVDERETITRALGIEQCIHSDQWVDNAAGIARLIEYIWTSEPLMWEDKQLLREAVASKEPALLMLVEEPGEEPLTIDQREALRMACLHNLLATGFAGHLDEPNKRGVRLEALIDYLGHI